MIKRVDRGTSVSTFCDGNAQTILKLLWNFISSVHEDLPMPTNAPYCASEGGLRMLARTISVELAKYNITVNNIAPGAIYTRIDADIEAKPELEKALMAEIPVNRWGEPEDVAGLAVYLASDEAGYVTGSTYFIDGGMLQQSGSY